jgi:hypothetical protein
MNRSTGGPCICDSNFSGPRCEYVKSTVPDCILPCKNGHCVLGPLSTTSKMPWWQNATVDINNDGNNDFNLMHCDCTNEFDGPLCDIPREACGTSSDSSFCYFGNKCNNGEDGSCICSDGYAGMSCEYVVTDTSEDGAKMAKNVTINVTEVSDFKDTDENRNPLPCNLNCVHGQCVAGKNNVSDYFGQVVEHTQHLYADASETQFMHCRCQESWTGPLCDVVMEKCENELDFCLHGSSCLNEINHPICNCSGSDVIPGAAFFAGQHCEHRVHDICTDDINSAHGLPLSFCVNGGICKSHVAAGEPHPGCNCVKDFVGPHCELRESVHIKNSELPRSWNSDNMAGSTSNTFHREESLQRSGIIIAIVILLVLAFAFLVVRLRRRRHRQKHESIDWINKYRDQTNDRAELNIAPRRESGVECGVTNSPFHETLSQAKTTASCSSKRDLIATQKPTITDKNDETRASMQDCIGSVAVKSSHNPSNSYVVSHQNISDGIIKEKRISKRKNKVNELQLYLGPPRDEDGHVLHNVDIL